MGSLMAGWDSPVPDPKTAKYKKNWSFTKGEIEAYWRSKKKTEEEHLKAISGLPEDSSQESTPGAEKKPERANSLPLMNSKARLVEEESEPSLENLMKNGWWTKSNWAFLNEPPVLWDAKPNSYAPQFHVANLASRKLEPGSDGISAS